MTDRLRKKKKYDLLFSHLSQLKLFYSYCIEVNHPLSLSIEGGKAKCAFYRTVSKDIYIYICMYKIEKKVSLAQN
jgi:hypothetical protein